MWLTSIFSQRTCEPWLCGSHELDFFMFLSCCFGWHYKVLFLMRFRFHWMLWYKFPWNWLLAVVYGIHRIQGNLTVSHTRLTGFERVSKLLWFSNILSKMLLNVCHITLIIPSVIPAWRNYFMNSRHRRYLLQMPLVHF